VSCESGGCCHGWSAPQGETHASAIKDRWDRTQNFGLANDRSPAHVDGELEAHRNSYLRARYSLGHVDRMPVDEVNRFDDLDRVRSEWFADEIRLDRLVHLGVNLRGIVQSEARVFHEEMQDMLRRGLAVSIHANQTLPTVDDDAADYERRGYLGPKFLFRHYLWATDSDREAMAQAGTPLSYATHSELRLGDHGDARASLMKARAAGVSVSLSSDASSIAPPNMFENMRFTWNMCIPWKATDTEDMRPLGFVEAIEMATINGARALGLAHAGQARRPDPDPRHRRQHRAARQHRDHGRSVGDTGKRRYRHGRWPDRQTRWPPDRYDVPAIVARAKESARRVREAAGGDLTPSADGCGNPIHRASAH
jgi:5-methylthioadenosine/S-adenosylhomocysteine deaminase